MRNEIEKEEITPLGKYSTRHVYIIDSEFCSRIKDSIKLGNEIHGKIVKYLRRHNNGNSIIRISTFRGTFNSFIDKSYPKLPRVIRDVYVTTIFYHIRRNGLKGTIKEWLYNVDLVGIHRVSKSENFTIKNTKINIKQYVSILLPDIYERPASFKTHPDNDKFTSVPVRQVLSNSTISTVNGVVKVTLKLYQGGYKSGVVIPIRRSNDAYGTLRNLLNAPFIYGNLLLNELRGTKPSQIIRTKSHRGLYYKLYRKLSSTKGNMEIKTLTSIMDRVAKEIFDEIKQYKRIPKTYDTAVPVILHIKKVAWGRISTDLMTITDIDTHLETSGTLDYNNVSISIDKYNVCLNIPNKNISNDGYTENDAY